jgi:methylglutaconyl-CoA hydratase
MNERSNGKQSAEKATASTSAASDSATEGSDGDVSGNRVADPVATKDVADTTSAGAATPSTVVYEVADQVATIRLNRPEARNALDPESMELLADLLDRAASDAAVRVVVLTGTGDTFSAGADVKAALAQDSGGFSGRGPDAMADLLIKIQDLPKPTIARVQGNVFGGGNGLVAACDLAIAVEPAQFAFSEVRLGLTPAVISVVCLPKLSRADAAELFLLGKRVAATRVRDAGLINAVAPVDQLDAGVTEWVEYLRMGGPEALAGTKELLREVPNMDRAAGFSHTAEVSGNFFRSPEAAEGMTALLGRRRPSWAPSPE